MKPGDVVWTQVHDRGSPQWIRVVVQHIWPHEDRIAVKPLFPGDAFAQMWCVTEAAVQTEEPSFAQLDSTYDDGSEQCV